MRPASARPRTPGLSRAQWSTLSTRWALMALVVVGAAVYANALHGPHLLDDRRAIVENASIRQLSPLSAVLHPPRQMPVTGRPLVNLSFAVNYASGELAVQGYHAWNIGVHVLAALALFGWLRLTFARMATSDALGLTPESAVWMALVCALVWVVHPLNSESVNYLTQRTESMMGLFYLTSLYAAARAAGAPQATERGANGRRGRAPAVRAGRWEVAAVASACASVACKETALTLPVMVVLWDRSFVFSSMGEAWAARRRLYLAIAASWLLFAWFARELPFFVPGGFEEPVARWTYFLNQGPMILHYLGLVVWPAGLIFDYGVPNPVTLSDVWLAILVVAALGLVTMGALWRRPMLGFWGAWFFVTLAPASSVIPIPTEVGAERRMYLPLIAVVVLAALAARFGLRRSVAPSWQRRVAWVLSAAVVLALGVRTLARNRDYADGLRIWQTVLDRRPHARAHEHLAMFLRDAGRIDESMAHLGMAAPQSPNALHALASARLERGDRSGALADYREFVTRHPRNRNIIEARETFGGVLLEEGDTAGAIEQFKAIVAQNPTYARGRVRLAGALARAGDAAGARAEYVEALRIQPQNLLALVNLGLLEAAAGQTDQAVATLQRALQVQPAELTARRRLASILLDRREFAALEAQARALIQYAPSDSDAHNLLGIALASQQQHGPAKDAFAEAVQLDPSNIQARQNLERLK